MIHENYSSNFVRMERVYCNNNKNGYYVSYWLST